MGNLHKGSLMNGIEIYNAETYQTDNLLYKSDLISIGDMFARYFKDSNAYDAIIYNSIEATLKDILNVLGLKYSTIGHFTDNGEIIPHYSFIVHYVNTYFARYPEFAEQFQNRLKDYYEA